MLKYLFLSLGILCLIIGVIGVVVPILPTTPFLLATAFCFAKGSARFNSWFTTSRLYQKYLADFMQNRSMSLKSKLIMLTMASAMLLVPFILMPYVAVRILILVLAAIMWWYFFCRIKTSK